MSSNPAADRPHPPHLPRSTPWITSNSATHTPDQPSGTPCAPQPTASPPPSAPVWRHAYQGEFDGLAHALEILTAAEDTPVHPGIAWLHPAPPNRRRTHPPPPRHPPRRPPTRPPPLAPPHQRPTALTSLTPLLTVAEAAPSPIADTRRRPTPTDHRVSGTDRLPFPPRPAELRLDGVDPCTLLPDTDEHTLNIHVNAQGTDPEGDQSCVWNTPIDTPPGNMWNAESKIYGGGVNFDFDPSDPVVQIDGFRRVRRHPAHHHQENRL